MNMNHYKLSYRAAKAATLLLALLSWGFAAQADTKVRTSSFEYDASGVLIKEVIEPDSPNDCLQTSYGYDGFGNKTSVSTSACAGASGYTVASAATARTASSNFGADGRFALSSSNALTQSETRLYDERFGAITSLTGPNGLTTTWVYDGFGRKTRENRVDGTYTTWAYLLCTEVGANCPGPIGGATVTWVTVEQSYAANGAPSAAEKRQYHDTLNRVVRVQTQGFDGAGAAPTLVQDTEYNVLGQLARASKLYALNGGTAYWASYTYDALGRVTRSEVPDPDAAGGVAVTTNSYSGLTSTATNSKGQTKTTIKNAQGQVALVTDALGNTISYNYDALGQLLSTNAAGAITSMSYNQRGQKVAMTDPAMGAWVYSYNAFGELVYQRDSLNQSSTMAYDVLGRLIQRTESDLISQWSYDKKFDGTPCGKGSGKLCEAKADSGYRRTHNYDALGRPDSTATVLDNPASPAVVSVAYDANTGRVASKTWPTGYQASYTYSPLGYLSSITGGGTNGFTQTVSYQIQAMNERGQITQYRYGNQVTTVKNHNAISGRLSSQTATTDAQGSGNVLAQTYGYDSLGNLITRSDNSPGVGTQESFSYDSLNRLTLAQILGGAISPPQTTEVMYDARGNIAYKSDVGRYWYDAARPNRMTNVTLETAPGATYALTGTRVLTYAFDDSQSGAQVINGTTVGNGNLMYTVSQDTVNNLHTLRSESYTSFNMPLQIVFGNFISSTTSTADRTLSFVYGPEHQRIRQTVALSGNGTSIYNAGSTWYLNGAGGLDLTYEKEIKDNGTTEHKHFVSAGGLTFAMFVSRTGNLNGKPAASTNYFHHDQLGSLAVITDETGAVTERLAYDPWGKRRNLNGVTDVLDSIVGVNTDRGYTMHEHLDEIGIIHMNGRIYDPLIGRFMSADLFVQSMDNLQSYNRYAYVLNNPLGKTDPSGYFSLEGMVKSAFTFWWNPTPENAFKMIRNQPGQEQIDNMIMRSPILYAVGQGVATYFGGPGGAAAWSAYYTYQATGSMDAAYRAGAITYATTYSFNYVKGAQWGSVPTVVANGTIGGVSAVAQGGSFKDGFLYAALPSAAQEYYKSWLGKEATGEKSNGEWGIKGEGVDVHEAGANNMGKAVRFEDFSKADWDPAWTEADPRLRWISSHVPGMQELSNLHDSWGGALERAGTWGTPQNVLTMLPAAAATYAAILGPAGGTAMMTSEIRSRNREVVDALR